MIQKPGGIFYIFFSGWPILSWTDHLQRQKENIRYFEEHYDCVKEVQNNTSIWILENKVFTKQENNENHFTNPSEIC